MRLAFGEEDIRPSPRPGISCSSTTDSEMLRSMQIKLLAFLQEGTFAPVGGRQQKQARTRVIGATHRDLEAMVRDGTFGEDQFYRLKGVLLRMPGLEERPAMCVSCAP
jgi:DNA-binding NtrC family response regulator